MDKIFKQLYPGVREEYLERAFEKLKKNCCPADEDLMVRSKIRCRFFDTNPCKCVKTP